jgi:RsfA family transcription factor
MRIDAWTKEEDQLLYETLKAYVASGRTRTEAFRYVAEAIGRTEGAVRFHWEFIKTGEQMRELAQLKQTYREKKKQEKANRKIERKKDRIIVKHFKGGIYEVLTPKALHSETQEELVVYKSLETDQVWVRPAKMFYDTVEHNGEIVPRFKEI